jgi:glycolate oxidase iron-sulfur subunit
MKRDAPTDERTCVKCGTCNTVCPVFQVTGHEAHGARGKQHLKSSLSEAERSPIFADIFSKCLLCGACLEACPCDLDTPKLLIETRGELPRLSGLSFINFISRKSLLHPHLIAGLSRVGSAANRLLADYLPQQSGLRLRLLSFDEDVLQLPDRSFLETLQHVDKKGETLDSEIKEQAINYFTGCFANHLQPEIAEKTSYLVSRVSGAEPLTPPEQTCCGMAALAAGKIEESRDLAKKNIQAYEDNELPILVSCSSCYFQLMSYEELFEGDTIWQERASRFAARLREFSTYFHKELSGSLEQSGPAEKDTKQRIFYHDPCHLRFKLQVTEEPRRLLKLFKEVDLQELPNGPQCCGQGGLFQVAYPDLAMQVQERLVEGFSSLSAAIVVTGCSGCLMQWQLGLAAGKKSAKAQHLAIFIAKLLQ